MDIKKQVEAKQKAFNVVQSCETIEHCITARRYIENYYDLTEDGFGYDNLSTDLNQIVTEIEMDLRLREHDEID